MQFNAFAGAKNMYVHLCRLNDIINSSFDEDKWYAQHFTEPPV